MYRRAIKIGICGGEVRDGARVDIILIGGPNLLTGHAITRGNGGCGTGQRAGNLIIVDSDRIGGCDIPVVGDDILKDDRIPDRAVAGRRRGFHPFEQTQRRLLRCGDRLCRFCRGDGNERRIARVLRHHSLGNFSLRHIDDLSCIEVR